MALKFGKKKDEPKPEPAEKYSEIDQGTVPRPEEISDTDKILANQLIIVKNQQAIYAAIEALEQTIIRLSGEEPAPPPTQEELDEALALIKKKKTV